MATNALPEQPVLLQLLRYEPDTGRLFWLARDVSLFANGKWNSAYRKACSWNAKNAGREALASVTVEGYRHGSINGQLFVAHRVIWKMVHCTDPEFIDHINGVRTDNRLDNLRSVSRRENSLNQRLAKNSTSGVCGVTWYKKLGKWSAKIRVNRRDLHLGYFDDLAAASSARKEAERVHGFHANHGNVITR